MSNNVETSNTHDISNNQISISNIEMTHSHDEEYSEQSSSYSSIDSSENIILVKPKITNVADIFVENDIIYEIVNRELSNVTISDLIVRCDLKHQHNSLKTITEGMILFIETLFADCSMIGTENIAVKYKKCIDNLLSDINNSLKLLIMNSKEIHMDTVISIYNDTKFQITNISLEENNSFSYLIKKINKIIHINKNLIIITTLWKKDENINNIVKSHMHVFINLLDIIIFPLKQDLQNIMTNAVTYEARILTDKNMIKRSTLTRTMSAGELGKKQKNVSISNSPPKLKRLESEEHDVYFGDFTSKDPLSYNDINELINASYGNTEMLESSTAIDILSTYLKGQKILYTEAKNYCERHLNLLMIPAIIIAAIASLVTQAWVTTYGRLTVSVLSAINLILLSLISFLKLDAKAEAHRSSAATYRALEMKCQFLSAKIMYVELDGDVDLKKEIEAIEEKVMETQTANSFVLPDYIVASYPEISNTNIFSNVKVLYTTEISLRNDLKTTVNKLRSKANLPKKTPEIQEEIIILEKLQDSQLSKIIEFRKFYLTIGKPFDKEIEKNVMLKQARWCSCFGIMNKLTCGNTNRLTLWLYKRQISKKKHTVYGELESSISALKDTYDSV